MTEPPRTSEQIDRSPSALPRSLPLDADSPLRLGVANGFTVKKRQIDLTFWAPDRPAADVLIDALKRNEMPPSLTLGPASPSDANQRWLVRSPIAASVTFITAKENVVTFLLFADKYDCDYGGWGTAIIRSRCSF